MTGTKTGTMTGTTTLETIGIYGPTNATLTVYTLSPDRRSATIKNTVRIFSNEPKTRRVTAADVTTITDWVLTGRGWLLYRMHRPITRAVRLGLPGPKARA